jgi:hypothetical protein
MAKNVIILGAGASVPYGAPVMRNFLDEARELYATTLNSEKDRKSFANVFQAISKLQSVHSKSEFDLINLESIFTTLELSKTLGRLPGHKPEEIEGLINDLKRLIVVTLEEKIRIPYSNERIRFPGGLNTFLKNVKSIQTGTPLPFSILTFNYDLLLDTALLSHDIGVDYGLVDREQWAGITMPLLKLHGSLNWGVETESKQIKPWFCRQFMQHPHVIPQKDGLMTKVGRTIYEFASHSNTRNQINELPFIVPPSWNKADSHHQIASVWSRAAQELSEADSIYIIGYSLPHTDSFFRQLYALGTVGESLLKRFWVYNPDASREEVFREMLGPGARERFKFFKIVSEVKDASKETGDPFEHITENVLGKKRQNSGIVLV